jgi:hypothetical protein
MAQQQAQRQAEKLERMGRQQQPGGLASVGSDMGMGGPQQPSMGLAAPALSMPSMGSYGVQPSGGSLGMPPPTYQPPTMAPSPFMSQQPAGPGYGAPPPAYGMSGGMYGGPPPMPQPMMSAPPPISVPSPGGAYGGGPGSFGAGGGPGSPTGMGGFGAPSPNSYGQGKEACRVSSEKRSMGEPRGMGGGSLPAHVMPCYPPGCTLHTLHYPLQVWEALVWVEGEAG